MPRQAATPRSAPPPAAAKPGKLDLWHKGFYPAIYLAVVIFFGCSTIYFGFEKLAADRQVERMKDEVKQHVEKEQQAKEDTQWLRVELTKVGERQFRDMNATPVQATGSDLRAQADARAKQAIRTSGVKWELDNIQKGEAKKFGEEIMDLWDKATKKAKEEMPIDWSDL